MAVLGLFLIVGSGVAFVVIFAAMPWLDLAVAQSFRDPGVQSVLSWVGPTAEVLRGLNLRLTVVTLGLSAVALVWFAVRRSPQFELPSRAALLIVLTFGLGPGLVANGLSKEFWGRPRPYQVAGLGGTMEFKPWWDPSGACSRNCSFISGEASSAFAMLAAATATPPPVQVPAIAAAVAYGLLIGIVRMTVGGHFLSDVLFSGVVTALIVWLLHGSLFRWRGVASQSAGSRGRLPAALRRYWQLANLLQYSAWDARDFGRPAR